MVSQWSATRATTKNDALACGAHMCSERARGALHGHGARGKRVRHASAPVRGAEQRSQVAHERGRGTASRCQERHHPRQETSCSTSAFLAKLDLDKDVCLDSVALAFCSPPVTSAPRDPCLPSPRTATGPATPYVHTLGHDRKRIADLDATESERRSPTNAFGAKNHRAQFSLVAKVGSTEVGPLGKSPRTRWDILGRKPRGSELRRILYSCVRAMSEEAVGARCRAVSARRAAWGPTPDAVGGFGFKSRKFDAGRR